MSGRSKRIFGVIERHAYDVLHNFDRLFDVFYWPVIDVILWGFLTIYLGKEAGAEFNFKSVLLSAIILWGLFYSLLRDIAVGFLEEIWSRNLINLFASPLSVGEHITGLLIVDFLKIFVSFIFTALLALGLYGFNIFSFAVAFAPYVLNILLFSLAIGFLVAAMILRYTSKVQTLAWSFSGLLMPVSAVLYPLSSLPPFLQKIALTLPTTYAFEGMRGVLAGQSFSPYHFWWGFGLSIFYLTIGVIFFKWIFEVARRRGLLVKLE